MKNIDFISVLFASFVYLIMYIVWYSSFLFGKIYKNKPKKGVIRLIFRYFYIFLCIVIISSLVALFEDFLVVTSFWDGVFLGFIIWLGFVGTHGVFSVISFNRSLKFYFIDNILYLLGLMIVAGILAG